MIHSNNEEEISPKEDGYKKLLYVVDQLILSGAKELKVPIIDKEKIFKKYELLIDNKDIMELLKYSIYLENSLRSALIRIILEEARAKLNEGGGENGSERNEAAE